MKNMMENLVHSMSQEYAISPYALPVIFYQMFESHYEKLVTRH